jgi:SAM-dependent methyltransferase
MTEADGAARADEAYHDREAARYDGYLADERTAAVEGWLAPFIVDAVGEGTIADLGCGTGRIAELLVRRGRRVVAVDHSRAMLEATASKIRSPELRVVRADVRALPIATASVDGVVCSGLLHHVPDWPRVLAEAARIVRPGGRIVVREPSAAYREALFAPVERLLGRGAPAGDGEPAPYERPIDPRALEAAAGRLPLRVEWIRTTMFLGSLLLPDRARAYYRLGNRIDRALFVRGRSGGGGALVVALLSRES